MDIFSHGLYGGIAFGKRSKRDYITAFLFGIGSDLLAFAPYILSILFGLAPLPSGKIEPPVSGGVPTYVHSLYYFTHSLVIYAVFFALLLYLGKKNLAKLTFGWPLHILVDIPTHSSAFFPTYFLWPVSNFSFNGTPWIEPKIFIPNVIVLMLLYIFWYFKKKRNV
ncbi:MAG: hypothetical protein ABIS26_00065 [Candidatus Paceibacterota bacterium]